MGALTERGQTQQELTILIVGEGYRKQRLHMQIALIEAGHEVEAVPVADGVAAAIAMVPDLVVLSDEAIPETLVCDLIARADIPEDRLIRFGSQVLPANDGTRLTNLVTISPELSTKEQTATVIASARGTSISRKPASHAPHAKVPASPATSPVPQAKAASSAAVPSGLWSQRQPPREPTLGHAAPRPPNPPPKATAPKVVAPKVSTSDAMKLATAKTMPALTATDAMDVEKAKTLPAITEGVRQPKHGMSAPVPIKAPSPAPRLEVSAAPPPRVEVSAEPSPPSRVESVPRHSRKPRHTPRPSTIEGYRRARQRSRIRVAVAVGAVTVAAAWAAVATVGPIAPESDTEVATQIVDEPGVLAAAEPVPSAAVNPTTDLAAQPAVEPAVEPEAEGEVEVERAAGDTHGESEVLLKDPERAELDAVDMAPEVALDEPASDEGLDSADTEVNGRSAWEERVREAKLRRARELVREAGRYRRDGRLGMAEAHYLKALQIWPRYPLAVANLVRIHLERKDGVEALRFAQRLNAMQPLRGNNQLLIGDAYALNGQRAKAEKAWQRAVRLGHAPAKRRLPDLD